MSRMHLRATAAFVGALALAGCASQSPTDKAAALTGPAAAGAAADTSGTAGTGPYAAIAKNLPHNLDGEIRRAQLLSAAGDLEGATHALAQLMLVAPDDPRVVGEYGKVLVQEGRTAESLAFLGRAVELQPDNWTFYSALGVAYDQAKQRAKAAGAYQHALALKPGEPTVLNNYAMSEMLTGHLDRAQTLLREAEAHGADNPKIAANLQMIAAMQGKAVPASAVAAAVPAVHHPVAAPAHLAATKAAKPVRHAAEPYSRQKAKTAPKVVMATVPYDPLAGKVYPEHREPAARPARHPAQHETKARLATVDENAKAAPHRDAAKAAAPALRTAADLY